MKIAIPTDDGHVAAHFGHCSEFKVFEVSDGSVVERRSVENPGHRPGFLPRFLAGEGVNLLIAGGIGSSAIEIFNELNIEVISGAQGSPEEVVEQYLVGELKSGAEGCREHRQSE